MKAVKYLGANCASLAFVSDTFASSFGNVVNQLPNSTMAQSDQGQPVRLGERLSAQGDRCTTD